MSWIDDFNKLPSDETTRQQKCTSPCGIIWPWLERRAVLNVCLQTELKGKMTCNCSLKQNINIEYSSDDLMLIDDIRVLIFFFFLELRCRKNRTVPQIFLFDIYDVSMRFQMQDQHNKVIEYNFKSCHTCEQMIHVKEKVPNILLTVQPGYCFVICVFHTL